MHDGFRTGTRLRAREGRRRPTWRGNLAECDRQIAQMERERATVTPETHAAFDKALAQLHAVRNAALAQMGGKR